MNYISGLVIFLAWLAYGLLHSLLASNAIKQLFPTRYYRIIYNCLSILLLLPILRYQFSLEKNELLPPGGLMRYVGMMLGFAGFYLISRASKQFDLGLFLGTKLPEKSKIGKYNDQEFVRGGILSVIRHSVNLGTICILWGYTLYSITDIAVVTATAITIYILIGQKLEEQKLLQAFGERYASYKKAVPALVQKWPWFKW